MKKNQLFLILIALLAFGQTVWAQNYYTDCSWDAENPMEGKDYAVVNAEPIGEMPVSFKAEENGSYTIGIDGVLEIVDVTGRVILRRDAKSCVILRRDAKSCVSTAGMVPGVYVLRLINGNDVKTQKIVIK